MLELRIRMEKRWVYYINAKRFELYMAGEDMKGDAFS